MDGEIDHGLAAGVEASSCVLFDDPLLGLMAYGGQVKLEGEIAAVEPRDGVRQQFAAVWAGRRLHVTLDRDAFGSGPSIRLRRDLARLELDVENRGRGPHETRLRIEGLPAGKFVLTCGAKRSEFVSREGAEVEPTIPVTAAGVQVTVQRKPSGD